MNYNKKINQDCQFGYSNICAYPEFFKYCLDHNLLSLEITILNYILSNAKNWEISPTQIANTYNLERTKVSKALTNLVIKLNGDLVIPSRSVASRGSLVDASKVYEKIFNEINRNYIRTNKIQEQTEETCQEIVDDEQQIEIDEKTIPERLLSKYKFVIINWPANDKINWCIQNSVGYKIIA